MSNPNNLSHTQHEQLTISTVGEINTWLEKEAVGNTAMSASYLDHMRSLIAFAKDNEQRDLEGSVYTLAGVIGRTSEDRLADIARQDGGNLPVEIEGITPLHEVTEDDITLSAAKFDMTNPGYKGYNDSIEISLAHSYIMDAVKEEIDRAENEES